MNTVCNHYINIECKAVQSEQLVPKLLGKKEAYHPEIYNRDYHLKEINYRCYSYVQSC